MGRYGEWMSIKDFAEAAGRTKQAIYKQIDTRLAPYVHVKDGKKYIEKRALYEVFEIENGKPGQPENNNSFNPENNPEHPLYAILREELAAKNRQIEQLQAQLAEQTQINKELAQSINADRKNELAGTLKEMLPQAELEPECQDETAIDVEPGDPEPEAELTESLVGVIPEPEEPGFWQRLRYAFSGKW